jgi:hypothetical protein
MTSARCFAVSIALLGALLDAHGAWAAREAADGKPALRLSTEETGLFLRVPREDDIVYRGVVSSDSADVGSTQMLYPAFDLASFLAAVVTHGVIVDSVKRGKKSKQQEAADLVLIPYLPALKGFGHKELMERGLARSASSGRFGLLGPTETRLSGWYVESAPIFAMTQDQRALVLDNVVAIQAADDPKGPSYRNVVRVVSRPRSEDDLLSYWTEDQGRRIREESVALFAESLDMVMHDVTGHGQDASPFKTLRYMQGGTEKMERAQLVVAGCERRIIRTLRGWLMSVPAHGRPAENCVASPSDGAR